MLSFLKFLPGLGPMWPPCPPPHPQDPTVSKEGLGKWQRLCCVAYGKLLCLSGLPGTKDAMESRPAERLWAGVRSRGLGRTEDYA